MVHSVSSVTPPTVLVPVCYHKSHSTPSGGAGHASGMAGEVKYGGDSGYYGIDGE